MDQLVGRDVAADVLPESVGGVREPQVDVAVCGECVNHRELQGAQTGRTEDRELLWEIHNVKPVTQSLATTGETLGRAVHANVVAQPPPQLRLPGEVGRELSAVPVGVVPGAPVEQHVRTFSGVGGVETGQLLCNRHPPAPVPGALKDAEMPTERAAPVLVRAAVDDLHQRPDHAGFYPRVLVRVHAARSSEGITDQATWRRQYDVCADAVRAARVRPERA